MSKEAIIVDVLPEPSDVERLIRSDPKDFSDATDKNIGDGGQLVRIATDVGRLWYGAMFYRHSPSLKRLLGLLASDPYYEKCKQTSETVTPGSLASFWCLGTKYTKLFLSLCSQLEKKTVGDFTKELNSAGVPVKNLHLHSMDSQDLVKSIFSTNTRGFGEVIISTDPELDDFINDLEKTVGESPDNVNSQVASLQASLSQKDQEIKQLIEEVRVLKRRNEQLGAQVKGLTKEVDESTSREAGITEKMAELTAKLDNTSSALEEHAEKCPFDQSVLLSQRDFTASKALFEKWLELMQQHIEPNTRGPLKYLRRYALFSKMVDDEVFRHLVADKKTDELETMANTVIAQCLVETGDYNKVDLGATKFGMGELRDELGKLTTSPESLHTMFTTLMKKSDVILETLKSTNFKFGGATVNPKVNPVPAELVSFPAQPSSSKLTHATASKPADSDEETAEEMERRFSALFG